MSLKNKNIIFKIRRSKVTDYAALRRCIYKKIHYVSIDLGVKVTQNVAQYPLHHVTYTPAKFEVAMSESVMHDSI